MPWPNAAQPGVPPDANRPWHWLAEGGAGHPMPVNWNPHLRQWMLWDRSTLSPEEAARRFGYAGPALTPAEAEAQQPAAPAAPSAPEEPRGLAALAASALPDPPPAMVYKKDAIRNHILIFVGTLVASVWIADMVVHW